MPTYKIIPQDLLFFRDGRPMEAGAGSGGHGARWPEPSILFDALHAALHRAFPERTGWEHRHDYGRSSHRPYGGDSAHRFGSLATAGPFPSLDSAGRKWLFPKPSDVTRAEGVAPEVLRPLRENGGSSDLPAPLLYALGNPAKSTKTDPKPWWSKAAMESYLGAAEQPENILWHSELFDHQDLFAAEWTTGIGIDATTGTQDGERIYSAEYLRLKEGAAMNLHATMPMKNGQPGTPVERLNQLFFENRTIIVGGQQRACQVEDSQGILRQLLPRSAPVAGDRLKWVLLSPAVFPFILEKQDAASPISEHPGGWLPNWIAPRDGYAVQQGGRTVQVGRGQVLLKASIPRNRQSREAWRAAVRQAEFLDCRLVAARIPKPMVLTGWSERLHLQAGGQAVHGPRPALLAVPAGTVYYFEGSDAAQLADALSWHGSREENPNRDHIANRRSTLLGEKGFGLGVCGAWDFYENR